MVFPERRQPPDGVLFFRGAPASLSGPEESHRRFNLKIGKLTRFP